MNEPKRLAELIDKRLHHQLTEKESVELESWASASSANRRLLERLQPPVIDRLLKSYLEIDDEKVFDDFLSRRRKNNTRKLIHIALKSAAAAMILFTVAWLGFAAWKAMRPDTLTRSVARQQILQTMRIPAVRPMLAIDKNIQYPDNNKPEETLGQIGHYTFQKKDIRHLAIEYTPQPDNYTKSDSIFSTFSLPATSGSWQLSLPDGSRVVLDAGSSISLILHPSEPAMAQRSVALEGKAIFQVEPNANAPFRVTTSRWDMSVLGTLFAVSDIAGESTASASLYKGSIAVSSGENYITLAEQQQATIKEGRKAIRLARETSPIDNIPWQNDYFDFSHEPLPVSMQRIANWYHLRRIEYHGNLDTIHPGIFHSGTIEKDLPLKVFLDAASTPDVRLGLKNDILVVTGK